jgi:hypothetical protein
VDQRISGSAVDGAPTEEPRPGANNAALPDLVLVLAPIVFCYLPVTRIWPLLFLHYRDNAKLKWQLLLLEVLHSTERWIVVP